MCVQNVYFLMVFDFSAEKNELLYKERGITFSQVFENSISE
jgi:hypothetical protein